MILSLLALQGTAPTTTPATTPDGTGPSSGSGLGSSLGSWIPILLVLGIFYVVLILPERKKQKKRQSMLDTIKKGDRVMTSGGIYGTVVQAANDVMVLQVADNVRMRFARAAIQSVVTEEPSEKASEVESREPAKG